MLLNFSFSHSLLIPCGSDVLQRHGAVCMYLVIQLNSLYVKGKCTVGYWVRIMHQMCNILFCILQNIYI